MQDTLENFKQEYTQAQIQAYFEAWQKSQHGTKERQAAWNAYCDSRDGLKQGTTQGRVLFSRLGGN